MDKDSAWPWRGRSRTARIFYCWMRLLLHWDPASVKEVEELLLQMNKEEGTTMIWITHHMEQARRVGHETWLMIDGRLVEQADTETFLMLRSIVRPAGL